MIGSGGGFARRAREGQRRNPSGWGDQSQLCATARERSSLIRRFYCLAIALRLSYHPHVSTCEETDVRRRKIRPLEAVA